MIDSTPLGQAIVFDQQGVMQVPNRPYTVIDSALREVPAPLNPDDGPGWRTVEEMTASIRRNAPEPKGLPEGAPNPNTVYLKDGQYVRYVVDTAEAATTYIRDGRVMRDVRFTPRLVSLTLKGARAASAAGTTPCDWWSGFTWIRRGQIPERDFKVMQKLAEHSNIGDVLTFEQPVSPTDEAVIRHQVEHLNRVRPTLPIETADTLAGEVKDAQSVPFPEAAKALPDGPTPTTDFVPSAAVQGSARPNADPDSHRRGPGRPPKSEAV